VEEIATFLRAIIEEGKYDLVVTLGNSMGGYAAILFASLIQADISIAISARSFLDLENRIAHNDNRRDAEIRRLYKISKGTNSEYLDLRRYLSSKPKEACKKPLYLLFFGDSDELDRIHSTRMDSLESFYVFKINEAGHNAAQKLRNRGGIDRIISSVMQFCEHRDERILLNSVSRDQLCDIVIQDRRMETENFRKSTTK
jgi:hypothetical protein